MTTNRARLLVATLLVACCAGVVPARSEGRAQKVRTEAFELLSQGVAAYRRGEYALAVDRLGRSAELALSSFRAHFYLGLALIGDRRYREALEALEVALDLDPAHLQSLIARGDAHLKLGDVVEAEGAYYAALKLRPEYPPALDGLARTYEARSHDDEAVAHFRRAIASDMGYAPAYTNLGDLYLRRGEVEEAVRLLEEAISVRPDFAPGLNRLARAYGRLGLDNQAMATIRRAMELEPRNSGHPAILGWLHLARGADDTAERWFRAALELDGANPDARGGLAEVARRRGDHGAALGELDGALGDPRLDAATRVRLEQRRAAVAAEQEQLAELERRIASDEATVEDWAALARIEARRGRWEAAVAAQQQVRDDPAQREPLAYMLFEAKRFREALELYRQLADEREDPTLEVNAGVCAAQLGDDERAVAAYRRALALTPDGRLARLYLGNALLRLGRREQAVAAYRGFLEQGDRGEAAERVRRILAQIAPGATAGGAPAGQPGREVAPGEPEPGDRR